MSTRSNNSGTWKQRACLKAGPLFFLLLLGGCSTTLKTLPAETDLPARIEISATPFFPQEQYQCGPAALATVLNFYAVEISPDALKEEIYLPGRHGTLQTEIVAATRRYDMIGVKLAPTLDALLHEIAAGNPVLVFQNLAFDWWPRWHFAVAIGYDLEQNQITLRSGTQARWTTPLSVFENTWRKGGYWALVIKPAGQMPATAEPLAYLEAASALESTGRIDAAHKSYRAAVERWPGNGIALAGLGNSAYQRGDYAESASALQRALTITPLRHELWNNLAYPLAAQGCAAEARNAIDCALELAPDAPAYLQSRNEIETMTDTQPRGPSCAPIICPAASDTSQ